MLPRVYRVGELFACVEKLEGGRYYKLEARKQIQKCVATSNSSAEAIEFS